MVIYIQFPLTSRVASEAGAAMELVNRIQTVFIDVCGDQNSYRCRHISYDDGIVHSSLLVDESHRIRFDYTGIFFYPNYNSRLEFVPVGKSFTMTLLHFMDVVINYMPLSLQGNDLAGAFFIGSEHRGYAAVGGPDQFGQIAV